MPTAEERTPRPDWLVRSELIRLDQGLRRADESGDLEGFERWARRVLSHPCAPHTWTVGLVTDMLADCLIEMDRVGEAIDLVAESRAAGRVAEPFATMRLAELSLLAQDRATAEVLWAEVVGDAPPEPRIALEIGLLLEDLVQDAEAAHGWYTAGIEAILARAEAGRAVDLGELEELMDAREGCCTRLGLPAVDAMAEQALAVPLPLHDAPPPEEFPPDPSTSVACARCGYQPDVADAVVPGHRLAVAVDPATGEGPDVDRTLRALKAAHGQTPVLVRAPAAAVTAWAAPYGYAGEEAADLYAAVAPDVERLPWPPARNEPCWCGSGQKYKRCCGR